MVESVFDPSWYRVAELIPGMKAHGQIHKHNYRGQIWYVLQDHASNKFHRFTTETYQLIKLMNSERTIQEIFDIATEKLGDDAPTQTETIQLLGQLHAADMLQCDISPDTAELFRRHSKEKKQKLKQTLRSPLSIRLPLIDPDHFLEKYANHFRHIFSKAGFLIWLLTIVSALVLAGVHWVELTENVSDRVLAPQNLLLIWLIFPLIKALHELGHGFVTKYWGGEVHEMGIMLLVFMPVPYVDASSASSFREQHKRVIVGAAGMLVEIFIAALAMFVWLGVEEGMLRSIAFNIMLIAGISTLLFNANPLLRFDGYYILADTLEIPNLASRANKYFFFLLQKYLYGVKDITTPAFSDGERRWFLLFSIASFLYRMFIYFTIVIFVAGQFFFIGILLALWAIASMFVVPIFKGLNYLFRSSQLNHRRSRALAYTSSILSVVFVFLFVVPMPWHTVTEGVLWPPEKTMLRMGTSAFIEKVLVQHGDRVTKGQALIVCVDPLLSTEIKKKKYELSELKAQQRAFRQSDLVQADIVDKDIKRISSELNRAREKAAELIVHSPVDGVFYVDRITDLPGKYLAQGEQLAYVLYEEIDTIRVVVPQDTADLVRNATREVEVRMATDLNNTIPATLQREVPAGSKELPSATFADIGGGEIMVDPREKDKLQTFKHVFQFDIKLDGFYGVNNMGARAYVRFYHGLSPLAYRWYLSLKRLLLRNFNV